MATPNARPTVFRIKTLSDAVDSTNGPPGAMQVLQNLIPAPYNRDVVVPRPAALQITNFSSFTTPAGIELQFPVGQYVYGFIQSGRFSGKSEPFVYNQLTNTFLTLQGVTAAKCPNQTSNTGDWTPPTAEQVGSRIMMTHPGFTGANNIVMGWFDISGFSSSAFTGNTNSNQTISGVASNPLIAGVTPGMLISSSAGDIPAGAYVTQVTATTITISVNATGSNTGVTLTITGGTQASPLYAAGNTNGRLLNAVPVAVQNFNGRAYYATGAKLDFSDAGNPLQISDTPAVQTINFQNGVPVTALGATPFTNVLGGITQTLIAFQRTAFIQQISGDPTTNNLLAQLLFAGSGTTAPNTISNAPEGLYFMAPDGLRIIATNGVVSPAIGTQGDGVAMPFVNAQFPTRMAGAWFTDTYRVAVTVGTNPASIWGQFTWGQAVWGAGEVVTQEYWFNTKIRMWTGPHTFPSTLISANPYANNFLLSTLSGGVGLWGSDAIGTGFDSYTELGQLLNCTAVTCLMPDNGAMSENCLGAQSTAIGFASNAGMTATIYFARENGQVLDNLTIPVSGVSQPIWGRFIWGSANWGSVASRFSQYHVPWHQPLVFKQGSIGISFPAGPGNLLGNIYLRIEPLNYLILGASDAA